MNPIRARSVFLPVMAGVVAVAWLALWLWTRSPWARYLDHADPVGLATVCGVPLSAELGLYVAGWLLMTVAMMLPSTLPLLEAFRRLTASRADRDRLLALVVLGYLGVWLAFGIVAHAADVGLHTALAAGGLPQTRAWVFGAGPLLIAGVFQFSALKHRCLERCRAPVGFVFQHWRGGNPARQALALGAHHGLFCVGCCWALMLLMFAVGTGNLAWMLGLGAIMAIEKNVAWGRHLSAPLGAALIAGALAITLGQLYR